VHVDHLGVMAFADRILHSSGKLSRSMKRLLPHGKVLQGNRVKGSRAKVIIRGQALRVTLCLVKG